MRIKFEINFNKKLIIIIILLILVIVIVGCQTKKDDNNSARYSVDRWLDSAQQLHSQLAYRLWPDMDKDEARSLFSKKYRGKDASGKEYAFDDDEINTLYNMKDKFISQIENN